MKHFSVPILSLLLALHLFIPVATAQWLTDPDTSRPICTSSYDQRTPTIAGDGSGGAFIAWSDNRSGSNLDIYSQRVDASGFVQWTTDGVCISSATNDQQTPAVTSDGSGGAIIAWADYRSGSSWDIYAQRIDASGAVQWTANGVQVSAASNTQESPVLVTDSAGGAIIAWRDFRGGSNWDVYAQRVSASGVVQWTSGGIAVSTASGDQYTVAITGADSGGAIIAWNDQRSGSSDIYAQRVDTTGAVRWTTNGVVISAATNHQYTPVIAVDGAGGAMITWFDRRSGSNYDIYAQRVNASGAVQWTADGVVISAATGDQMVPSIMSEGVGIAIIAWQDYRSGNADVYAQKVKGVGEVQWTSNGVAVSTASYGQTQTSVVTDYSGGAIVVWHDLRTNTDFDIYAQKLSSTGVAQWTADGVAVSTAPGDQQYPTVVTDEAGGVIITWYDRRSGSDDDIYASRCSNDGALPVLWGSFTASVDASRSSVLLEWTTEAEVDNYGFEVERRRVTNSISNIQYPISNIECSAIAWATIGFVAGCGTSVAQRNYSFLDADLSPGHYAYRLRQIDTDGKVECSRDIRVDVTATGTFRLGQNHPNPFNPSTTLEFDLPERCVVRIIVYNALGQRVAVVVDGIEGAGHHELRFDAADLPSGVYVCRLEAIPVSDPGGRGSTRSFSEVKKIVLLR